MIPTNTKCPSTQTKNWTKFQENSYFTHYLIDVTPSKSKHQMNNFSKTCPFIPIKIYSADFYSADFYSTDFYSTTPLPIFIPLIFIPLLLCQFLFRWFLFHCALFPLMCRMSLSPSNTILNIQNFDSNQYQVPLHPNKKLDQISGKLLFYTLPDRCYPFKVQTPNEQFLQDMPFYTHQNLFCWFLFRWFFILLLLCQFLFRWFLFHCALFPLMYGMSIFIPLNSNMDILRSCEIHEVSPGPMIHTQLVYHKNWQFVFFIKIPFQAIIIF